MPSSREISARVRAAHANCRCFVPPNSLPVLISPANRENPYSLASAVLYDDGVVSVKCAKGFQWDAASIPTWWPVAPWLATLIAQQASPGYTAWGVTLLLMLYTLRLLPYMQKMGRHVRAACIHDQLYRSRRVNRAIADAIMLEIMVHDGVPIDIRWHIYLIVRCFGWTAYRSHPPAIRAEAESNVEVAL